MIVTDLGTFMLDESDDRIFRFLVYRKLYTPYEMELKAIDESVFEDSYYRFAYLREAIDLGYGEWLLGFDLIDECTGEPFGEIEYHKLSDIQLTCFECDQDIPSREAEDDEEFT